MNLPRIRSTIDERFLEHRRRSTSIAGMITAALALLVFLYRTWFLRVIDWDLFAVGVTFVVIKLTVLLWDRVRD